MVVHTEHAEPSATALYVPGEQVRQEGLLVPLHEPTKALPIGHALRQFVHCRFVEEVHAVISY